MSVQSLPEKQCPACNGLIHWKVIRDELGSPLYNGLCCDCGAIMRNREAPDVTQGKNLEKYGHIGRILVKDLHALDKRITKFPLDVQIGILRQRQHSE